MIAERELAKRVERGENAAHLVESSDDRRSVEIFARPGSPVVAVNDGQIKKVGENERLGNYVVLQDAYGNRFTYARLGSVARFYLVPKEDALERTARAVTANDAGDPRRVRRPRRPLAGRLGSVGAAAAGRRLAGVDADQGTPLRPPEHAAARGGRARAAAREQGAA